MANGELKIEKGIPIPPRSGAGAKSALRIALEQMAPGDSLLLPAEINMSSTRTNIAELFGKGGYAIRRDEGSYRVWRIK